MATLSCSLIAQSHPHSRRCHNPPTNHWHAKGIYIYICTDKAHRLRFDPTVLYRQPRRRRASRRSPQCSLGGLKGTGNRAVRRSWGSGRQHIQPLALGALLQRHVPRQAQQHKTEYRLNFVKDPLGRFQEAKIPEPNYREEI